MQGEDGGTLAKELRPWENITSKRSEDRKISEQKRPSRNKSQPFLMNESQCKNDHCGKNKEVKMKYW